MGAVEADGEEKRLLSVAFFEQLDRGLCEIAINEFVVSRGVFVPGDALLVARLHLHFAGASGRVGTFVLEGSAEIPGLGGRPCFRGRWGRPDGRFCRSGRWRSLARGRARERHDARNVLVEVVFVVGDAGGVGAEARKEGGAGGIAVGKLAVGTFKEDAALGQSVEVRRIGKRMSIAAEVGGEVVGHEEEDVLAGRTLGGGDLHDDRESDEWGRKADEWESHGRNFCWERVIGSGGARPGYGG